MKQKLQEEESALKEQLKYDEVLLGIEQRAEKSLNMVEIKSSLSAAQDLK